MGTSWSKERLMWEQTSTLGERAGVSPQQSDSG